MRTTRTKKQPDYPPPPAHLSARSKRLWQTLGPKNCANDGRRVLFQSALEALDRGDQCGAAIARKGLIAITPASGVSHVNPAALIEVESRAQFSRMWLALGLADLPASFRDSFGVVAVDDVS